MRPSPEVEVPAPETEILEADLAISFDYTRSLGPVLSPFALALREGRILGGRTSDGRVLVPPSEFDPETGRPTHELVEVGTAGVVTSWSWQPEPLAGQPLSKPFAWALIQLDGAESALLHAVDVDSPVAMSTGMRVQAAWREARTGRIDDIACFVPFDGAQGADVAAQGAGGVAQGADVGAQGADIGAQGAGGAGSRLRSTSEQDSAAEGDSTGEGGPTDEAGSTADERVVIETPVALEIRHAATEEESWYLDGLKHGKLYGGRVTTGEVYFPPRQASPADGSRTTERVELPDTGIVTTFCIVNVPFLGQQITPPYVAAYVLLDGADIPFLHLILDCPADEVRMGMRVKAVWRPEDEWDHTLKNISHFAPTGEPDAPREAYRDHL